TRVCPSLILSLLLYTDHHRSLPSFPTRRSSDLIESPFPYSREALGLMQTLGIDPPALTDEANKAANRTAIGGFVGFVGQRGRIRSEEHTSELQSLAYLVCRLLLEKKNSKYSIRKPFGNTSFTLTETISETRKPLQCVITILP